MGGMALSRRRSQLRLATRRHSKSWASQQHKKKKRRSKKLDCGVKRLRDEMEEIGEEQTRIKEGQRQVREKFEAIETECQHLRKETNVIIQQSVNTQVRLALMFQILKARENHDFSKAAQLTCALRELVARENRQEEA